MKEKEIFRTLYVSFYDDTDVRQLSHLAYRVLTVLKGTLPSIGIAAVHMDLLAERCNCSEPELDAALAELERPKRTGGLGWIVRARSVVWLVNGLKFEHMTPSAPPWSRWRSSWRGP